MRIRKNRDLIIFVILIPVFLYMAFFISERLSGKLPQYSVINKAKTGYSVIFEALQKLNYSCKRTISPVDKQGTDKLQVVADAQGSFNLEAPEVKKWINSGGKLLYLSPMNVVQPDYGRLEDKKRLVRVYSYGKGLILTTDASYFMNKTLVRHKTNAYEILKTVDKQKLSSWIFNENHLYAKASANSLWEYIPVEGRFLIYQLLLVVMAFFYYKGKRFGKPIPLYEEVERDENEYLYAAAAIYNQANCWDVMLENYYKNFLRYVDGDKDNWFEAWKQNGYPQPKKAEKLKEFMDNTNRKIRKKEYIELVSIMEELTEILKKRRELYWKTMKNHL